MIRVSTFKKGDRVRLIRDCRDFNHGETVFRVGELGTLDRLYRVQDGWEIWSLILDRTETLFSGGPIKVRITAKHLDLVSAL